MEKNKATKELEKELEKKRRAKALEKMWYVQNESYLELMERLKCNSYDELKDKIEKDPKVTDGEKLYFATSEQFKDIFFECMKVIFTEEEGKTFIENMNRKYNGC